MNSNESRFHRFLTELGFSPARSEAERFVYSFSINQNQQSDIEFVYAPQNADFKTKVFEEHRRIWNSNYANAFVLVSDSETIVINPKVKPDVSKPLRGKIDSFNAGIRTEIDPQTLELLSRQQINAGYFFDFVRVKLG